MLRLAVPPAAAAALPTADSGACRRHVAAAARAALGRMEGSAAAAWQGVQRLRRVSAKASALLDAAGAMHDAAAASFALCAPPIAHARAEADVALAVLSSPSLVDDAYARVGARLNVCFGAVERELATLARARADGEAAGSAEREEATEAGAGGGARSARWPRCARRCSPAGRSAAASPRPPRTARRRRRGRALRAREPGPAAAGRRSVGGGSARCACTLRDRALPQGRGAARGRGGEAGDGGVEEASALASLMLQR